MPETDQDKRYINVPLILLRDVHLNYKEAMNSILLYGIVNSALKWNIELHDAARQVIYDYYHNQAPIDLKRYLDEFKESWDKEYNADFNGFDQLGDIDSEKVSEVVCSLEVDTDLQESAIVNAQLHGIDDFFNIEGQTKKARLDAYYRIERKISGHFDKFGNDPYPGLEINLYWDFKKQPPDPELFTAYMAIRSLQGKNNYAEVCKKVVLMRMFGAKNQLALDEILKTKALKEKYDKYARSPKALRCNMDKLFKKLLNRGLLRSKIFMRQVSRKIYLSTTIDHADLTKVIIKKGNRRNHKKKELEAREKIFAAIQ